MDLWSQFDLVLIERSLSIHASHFPPFIHHADLSNQSDLTFDKKDAYGTYDSYVLLGPHGGSASFPAVVTYSMRIRPYAVSPSTKKAILVSIPAML